MNQQQQQLILEAPMVMVRYGLLEEAVIVVYDEAAQVALEPILLPVGKVPTLFFKLIDAGFSSVPHELDESQHELRVLKARGVQEALFFKPDLVHFEG